MASSKTKKKILDNIQLIYLGMNGNLIWLQGMHQIKKFEKP